MNPIVEVMRPAFTSGDGYFYESRKHPFRHITIFFSDGGAVLPEYKRHFKPGRLYLIRTVEKKDVRKWIALTKKHIQDGTLHLWQDGLYKNMPHSLRRIK